MKLGELVDTETDGIDSLMETYTTVSREAAEEVQKFIIQEIGQEMYSHLNSLWLPESREEIMKPVVQLVLPAKVRARIVEMLDDLYADGAILLKFHQYSVICNSCIEGMLAAYKERFQQRVTELGGTLPSAINN